MSAPGKFLRRDAAAEYLKSRYGFCTKSSLAKYASEGSGPEMQYYGRVPLYPIEGLDHWAESRLTAPVNRARPRVEVAA
jgi:hypothetical protein